ncbi:hypothetical protein F3Y22_tig00006449pilonHSYRG00023 [Hibiscus syriacus]|uniref:Uncharacterized protein n=1 Tax=Hibiscus syriacus TaxID=106335 RepID=A0A6A3CH00_HIBSY|nr:hypothetical protein F3Y22_tig00006449pilonHSYRG00023 [Hibiscus syriacus]
MKAFPIICILFLSFFLPFATAQEVYHVEQYGRYNGFPAPRRPGPQHSTKFASCFKNGSPVECHSSPPPPHTMATAVTRGAIVYVGRRNCPCHH